MRQYVFPKVSVGPLRPLGIAGDRALEAGADIGGNRTPDRAFPHGLEVGEQVVHHAVAEGAKLVPAVGIERFLRAEGLEGGHGGVY
jgi:hypothetical protein